MIHRMIIIFYQWQAYDALMPRDRYIAIEYYPWFYVAPITLTA